jgi:hypothetical protein
VTRDKRVVVVMLLRLAIAVAIILGAWMTMPQWERDFTLSLLNIIPLMLRLMALPLLGMFALALYLAWERRFVGPNDEQGADEPLASEPEALASPDEAGQPPTLEAAPTVEAEPEPKPLTTEPQPGKPLAQDEYPPSLIGKEEELRRMFGEKRKDKDIALELDSSESTIYRARMALDLRKKRKRQP